jgi:septal ring factor EnvC (AmiA/AmiB activator)
MRQVLVIQQPTPPASPRGPSGDGQVITQREIDRAMSNVPMTAQEVAVLQARRSELSRQLNSAEGRRREVQKQLTNASGPQDRAGLEQRIGVLDARISGLENDIGDVGRQLSSAPAALATSRPPQFMGPTARNRLAENVAPITIVFTLFVLAPLAFSISRGIWKRGSMPRQVSSPADAQRLERMEQAMEAIAIEIERVSEGQRFVTRLLSEQRANVPVGAAQPAKDAARIPAKQPTPV